MDAALRKQSIALADIADFRFGALAVSPSTRQVTHKAGSVTLEPRVMQVLVALTQADGRVVSRDALLDRCWDGTIVSDNAIARVIARLRRLSEETGTFTIETVARVGYRITAVETKPVAPLRMMAKPEPPPAADPAGTKRPVKRRWLLIGGIAMLGAGGTAALLRPLDQPTAPNEQAAMLVTKARVLLEVGDRGVTRQAIRMLEEAVALDPDRRLPKGRWRWRWQITARGPG